MLCRIGFFCLFCFSLFGAESVYLKAPHISHEEVIGTGVGIRPYRKSGVRLEAESFHDKLIIHNYGYGGSGLTLAFGGANEVMELLDNRNGSSKSVAVLGAGVAGLTTAYDLLESGYEVHIYSDQWNPDLTSNIAAGIWTPSSHPLEIPEEKISLYERMVKIAEQRFLKSATDSPEFAGVRVMSYYSLTPDGDNTINNAKRGAAVIVHFDNGLIKQGRRSSRLGIDGKVFMNDLFAKVKSKGAVLCQRHFESAEDLLNLEEPIIINCTSMGSRRLFDDQEFVPIRGQLVYLKVQEGVDYALGQSVPNSDFFISIYPWSDRLILGGIYEIGEETLATTPEVTEEIIQNAQNCLCESTTP